MVKSLEKISVGFMFKDFERGDNGYEIEKKREEKKEREKEVIKIEMLVYKYKWMRSKRGMCKEIIMVIEGYFCLFYIYRFKNLCFVNIVLFDL